MVGNVANMPYFHRIQMCTLRGYLPLLIVISPVTQLNSCLCQIEWVNQIFARLIILTKQAIRKI